MVIMKKFPIHPPGVASLVLLLTVVCHLADASVLVVNDKNNNIAAPEESTTTASRNAVRTRSRTRIRPGDDGQQRRRGLLYDSVMSYPREEDQTVLGQQQPHKYRRDLKGSGSSSNDGSSGRCSKFIAVLKKADIVANQVDLDFGYTLQVDLYNGVTTNNNGGGGANNNNNNNNNRQASSNTNSGITDAFDGDTRRNLKTNFLSRNKRNNNNKKKKMNIAKKKKTAAAVSATRVTNKIGSWYESIVYTDPKTNSVGEAEFAGKSGFGNVMVTFNKNTALSLAAALDQNQYPITGGSGMFAQCPGGYAMKLSESATTVTIQFYVCMTC